MRITFEESRFRFPLSLAWVMLPCAVVGWSGEMVLATAARVVMPTVLIWALFRAIRPARVLVIDDDQLWLRSRRHDRGWLDVWRMRQFDDSDIQRIEIGTRSDFSILSYSDTFNSVFLVVDVILSPDNIERFSYAPLQRVSDWLQVAESLKQHPQLGPKVHLGEMKPSGNQRKEWLARQFKWGHHERNSSTTRKE